MLLKRDMSAKNMPHFALMADTKTRCAHKIRSALLLIPGFNLAEAKSDDFAGCHIAVA
jgi:hypothetical protein